MSALWSGVALNAAGTLGARAVAALRVSFAEPRERHRGLSHHSRTILEDVCLVPVTAVVPRLEGDRRDELWATIRSLTSAAPVSIVEANGEPALALLRDRGVDVESMGRTVADDPAFFLAAGAAGVAAARMRSDAG